MKCSFPTVLFTLTQVHNQSNLAPPPPPPNIYDTATCRRVIPSQVDALRIFYWIWKSTEVTYGLSLGIECNLHKKWMTCSGIYVF